MASQETLAVPNNASLLGSAESPTILLWASNTAAVQWSKHYYALISVEQSARILRPSAMA